MAIQLTFDHTHEYDAITPCHAKLSGYCKCLHVLSTPNYKGPPSCTIAPCINKTKIRNLSITQHKSIRQRQIFLVFWK